MRKIIKYKSVENNKPLGFILKQICRDEAKTEITGIGGAARPFILSLLFHQLSRCLLVVCSEEKEALSYAGDLSLFLGEDSVLFYPPYHYLTVDMFGFQRAEESARLSVLSSARMNEKKVIVTCATALPQKVMPVSEFGQYLRKITSGEILDTGAFISTLANCGYKRVSLVEEKGEFSMRGNIIDVFSTAEKFPLRLELYGEQIEAIRIFDSTSQRSAGEKNSIFIAPASQILTSPQNITRATRNIRRRAGELSLSRTTRNRLVEILQSGMAGDINPVYLSLFYEEFGQYDGLSRDKLSTFFDYLPSNAMLIIDDLLAAGQAARKAENYIEQLLLKSGADERFYPEKQDFYPGWEDVISKMEPFNQIWFDGVGGRLSGGGTVKKISWEEYGEIPNPYSLASEIKDDERMLRVASDIKKWLAEGMQVFFVCPTPHDLSRMSHLLSSYDLPVRTLPRRESVIEIISHQNRNAELILLEGKLSASFVFPLTKLVFISEEEIFVRKAPRRRSRPARETYFLKSFGDLKEGDYVVHTDFGIGLYRGLKKINVGKIENDFLVIEYLDADKLYIPVNSFQKIQKYLGPEGYAPKIDKMGGTSWESVKEKVRKSVREVAEELASIYATREVMERKAFSPTDQIYDELCSDFEFEETPDQTKAIEDINQDMDNVKPMDRLICGDAGFGKTEVAIRASFRAVMDGRQVALLAPTTILAEQHYQTFSQRLKNFPIRVEVLNRFKTAARQKEILRDLKKQKVDIIIGTHRLLQKDVEFNQLGLLIIDEEQRFGVAHKERLKKVRTLVDVLALSATPIPRTLHLSLVGIRDLSVINTPPEERLPIKTHVLEFDENVIKLVLDKELARDGQVFFVHDRINSIGKIAGLLERLVPGAKIGIVHGQMKASEIEKTMSAFVRREIDILVSTTIVSSGLDIPSANTIIINRADKLGLAQLYQLRGRVGRCAREAYAYLLLPPGAMLSAEALKRLRVVKEFSEPGSGFRIARNDLEIRGGGNLLGISQSGHIRAVGYELYTELMEKTMREIKGEKAVEEEYIPEINLGISALIPEAYVQDVYQRLILYKRISLAANEEDIYQIRNELLDCYGALPEALDNLLRVINIRNRLKMLGGEKMGYDGRQLYIFFRAEAIVNPQKIISLCHDKISKLRFTPDYKLFFPIEAAAARDILARADSLLKMLAQ